MKRIVTNNKKTCEPKYGNDFDIRVWAYGYLAGEERVIRYGI